MSHKHIAKQFENGVFCLERDGILCQCPKAMVALPQQNAMGGMQFSAARIECSTLCPFASIDKRPAFNIAENGGSTQSEGTKSYYVIECEGRKKEIELDNVVEYKKPGSGLVSVN